VLNFLSGEMLSMGAYFAQLTVGALTWACLVGVIYSGVEIAFPRLLADRDSVRYEVRPAAMGLVGLGFTGLAIAGWLWTSSVNGPARDAVSSLTMLFWVSAAIFDVGALMWLTSEVRPDA
jgi:hypothetical protein